MMAHAMAHAVRTIHHKLPPSPPPPSPAVREEDEVQAIQPEHRQALVPLLIRLLFPKVCFFTPVMA